MSTNPTRFWFYVRKCKSEDIGIQPMRSDNKLHISDQAEAEALNSHSIFTKEREPVPTKGLSQYSSIADLGISTQGVHKQLSQLNPSKACGPDELPARVLKELAPSISSWLCYIFQQSYTTYKTVVNQILLAIAPSR